MKRKHKRQKQEKVSRNKRLIKMSYSLLMLVVLLGTQLTQSLSFQILANEKTFESSMSSSADTSTEQLPQDEQTSSSSAPESDSLSESSDVLSDESDTSTDDTTETIDTSDSDEPSQTQATDAETEAKIDEIVQSRADLVRGDGLTNSINDQYGGKIYTMSDVEAAAAALGMKAQILGDNKGTYGGVTTTNGATADNTTIGDIWVDDATTPTKAGVKDVAGWVNALSIASISEINFLADFYTPEGNKSVWDDGIRKLKNGYGTDRVWVEEWPTTTGRENKADMPVSNMDGTYGIHHVIHINLANIARQVTINGRGHTIDMGYITIWSGDTTQPTPNAGKQVGILDQGADDTWDVITKDLTIYAATQYGGAFSPNMGTNELENGDKIHQTRVTYDDVSVIGSQAITYVGGHFVVNDIVTMQQTKAYKSAVRGGNRNFIPSHVNRGQPLVEAKHITVKENAIFYGRSYSGGFSSGYAGHGSLTFERNSQTTIIAGLDSKGSDDSYNGYGHAIYIAGTDAKMEVSESADVTLAMANVKSDSYENGNLYGWTRAVMRMNNANSSLHISSSGRLTLLSDSATTRYNNSGAYTTYLDYSKALMLVKGNITVDSYGELNVIGQNMKTSTGEGAEGNGQIDGIYSESSIKIGKNGILNVAIDATHEHSNALEIDSSNELFDITGAERVNLQKTKTAPANSRLIYFNNDKSRMKSSEGLMIQQWNNTATSDVSYTLNTDGEDGAMNMVNPSDPTNTIAQPNNFLITFAEGGTATKTWDNIRGFSVGFNPATNKDSGRTIDTSVSGPTTSVTSDFKTNFSNAGTQRLLFETVKKLGIQLYSQATNVSENVSQQMLWRVDLTKKGTRYYNAPSYVKRNVGATSDGDTTTTYNPATTVIGRTGVWTKRIISLSRNKTQTVDEFVPVPEAYVTLTETGASNPLNRIRQNWEAAKQDATKLTLEPESYANGAATFYNYAFTSDSLVNNPVFDQPSVPVPKDETDAALTYTVKTGADGAFSYTLPESRTFTAENIIKASAWKHGETAEVSQLVLDKSTPRAASRGTSEKSVEVEVVPDGGELPDASVLVKQARDSNPFSTNPVNETITDNESDDSKIADDFYEYRYADQAGNDSESAAREAFKAETEGIYNGTIYVNVYDRAMNKTTVAVNYIKVIEGAIKVDYDHIILADTVLANWPTIAENQATFRSNLRALANATGQYVVGDSSTQTTYTYGNDDFKIISFGGFSKVAAELNKVYELEFALRKEDHGDLPYTKTFKVKLIVVTTPKQAFVKAPTLAFTDVSYDESRGTTKTLGDSEDETQSVIYEDTLGVYNGVDPLTAWSKKDTSTWVVKEADLPTWAITVKLSDIQKGSVKLSDAAISLPKGEVTNNKTGKEAIQVINPDEAVMVANGGAVPFLASSSLKYQTTKTMANNQIKLQLPKNLLPSLNDTYTGQITWQATSAPTS